MVSRQNSLRLNGVFPDNLGFWYADHMMRTEGGWNQAVQGRGDKRKKEVRRMRGHGAAIFREGEGYVVNRDTYWGVRAARFTQGPGDNGKLGVYKSIVLECGSETESCKVGEVLGNVDDALFRHALLYREGLSR